MRYEVVSTFSFFNVFVIIGTRQLKLNKPEMTISTIVGVGLCSTRHRWFAGGVEPRPNIWLLMRCLATLHSADFQFVSTHDKTNKKNKSQDNLPFTQYKL